MAFPTGLFDWHALIAGNTHKALERPRVSSMARAVASALGRNECCLTSQACKASSKGWLLCWRMAVRVSGECSRKVCSRPYKAPMRPRAF